MNTTEILEKTKKLVSESRHDKHGDKVINHENIGRLWNAYFANKFKLNLNLLPEDVANMMCLLKIARTQAGSFNLDDHIDAAGYAGISGEIAFKRNNLKSTTLGVSNAKNGKNTKNN